MTKTITMKSKREFLHDTNRDILIGRYKCVPASSGVSVFTKAVAMFNDGIDEKDHIVLTIKYAEQELAKVKLKGRKDAINTFINRLIVETDIMEYFDMKF